MRKSMLKSKVIQREAEPHNGDSRLEVVQRFDVVSVIDEHLSIVGQVKNLAPAIAQVARQMIAVLRGGGKVLWMGNGGSAADSQHLAAELVGRFARERPGLASIALTTDTSILTALANDYCFDRVFSRQIEALCFPQDMVVGISTSGNSKNVLLGVSAAKKIGAYTVGLSGGSGKLGELVDMCINVPAHTTARIQEAHILVGHILCDSVERAFCEMSQP
jgi:D-sedoheptulose 7-phosphate isomerase